jgi:hypothetical protein
VNAADERTAVGVLPNFLIIGAMKAGTTSLYHYLRAHPQVFMPTVKELDFFAREPTEARGIRWYARQFAGGADALAVGEASTMYTKHPRFPGTPERIVARIPDAKLIYVVRDPLERIRSHYQHQVALGAERAPFAEAVFGDPIYLDVSRYAMQIERYLECFDRDQLLVITAERLREDRPAVVRRIYGFLGVDRDFVAANLEREFYRTEDRPVHSRLAWRVRRTLKHRIPALKRAKELVDSPALRFGRGAREPIADAARFEIDGGVRDRLVRALGDDVRRLRSYMEPGFDGWGIA